KVGAKDRRESPDEVAPESPRAATRGLGVDHQIAAGHQVVEVLHGGVAADKGLGLVQIGGGTTIELAELDGLILVQRAEAAALHAAQHFFKPPPFRSPFGDESCQVHRSKMFISKRVASWQRHSARDVNANPTKT